MANRTIKMSLSQSSIRQAIDELNQYKESLKSKNDLFVRRLAEVGIPVIDQRISAAKGDSDKNHNTYIKLNSFGDYSQAELIVEGRQILFIEFGSGIFHNTPAGTSPHPKGEEFGYTIGSYGKGHGKDEFWYYQADTGEYVRSYGTQATMPVYSASVEIRARIQEIAREVFSS